MDAPQGSNYDAWLEAKAARFAGARDDMAKLPNVDWNGLARSVGGEVTTIFTETLGDEAKDIAADLRGFGFAIAHDMVLAIKSGREALHDELLEQWAALAAIQNIRIERGAWSFLERALKAIFRAVFGALLAVVGL